MTDIPSIADVYVTVIPETARIARDIREALREADPSMREAGARWGREIQESIGKPKIKPEADTAKAEEELGKTARERKPKIKPEADTKKATEDLDKAARDRRSKIFVDVDKSQLSQLNNLINTGKLDQAKSFADLMRVQQEVRRIAASPTSGSQGALEYSNAFLRLKAAEKSFASSMQEDLGSAVQSGLQSGGTAGISALQPALLGIGATMLAGIASALSGLAALIPAGLLGAGGVVGTLAIGLDGVKDAYDAVNKASQSSGQDQIDKARETATAQRGLTDAVQSQAQAQRDVSTAYRDAKNNLDDLNLSLQGGKISEAQAYNNVLKARRDLAKGGFKDTLEQNDAILRVQSSEQQWQESKQRNVELSQKANDANSKGIENSDQVVSAKERERKANEQVAAAQDSLSLAQNKTSAAAKDAALEMAQLSPQAQAFVNTLMAMKPQFQEFKNSIQDALFLNIGPQFQQLAATYMPVLQGFMTSMASTMNQAFGQIAGFLQQPATMQAMQQIFANIGQSFQVWSQSLQPFSEAFLKVTQVGSTFLPQLAQMVVQVAQAFNQWAQSGQLGTWIQTGMTALQQLGGLIQQLLPMFAQLAPIGIATMSGLQTIFAALAPAIGPLSTAFTSLIVAITPLLGLIGQSLATSIQILAPAFTQWFNAMGPVLQQLAGALGPVMQQLAPVMGQLAMTLANEMVKGWQAVAPFVGPFVQQMGQLLIAVAPLLPSLMQIAMSAMPAFRDVMVAILPILIGLTKVWTDQANYWVPLLSKVIGGLAQTFQDKWNVIKTIVQTVWDVVQPIFEKIKQAIDDVATPLGKVFDLLGKIPGLSGLLGPGAAPFGSVPGAGRGTGSVVPKTAPPAVPGAPGVTPASPPNWTPPGGQPMQWVPGQGYVPMAAPTGAAPSSMTKDQVAQLIISEAQRRGFSREQTLAVLSTAMQESGLDPAASGGGGAWHGIFQQDTSYPGRDNPATNIGTFFDRLGAPGSDIWSQIFQLQQGTPLNSPNARTGYLSEIQSQLGPATNLYNQFAGGTSPMTAMPSTAGLPAAGLPDAHGAHPQIAMVEQIAQKFGLTLTAGKDDHAVDQGFHPLGEAGDFSNGSGNTPQELAFAQYMAQNFAPYIQELIYSDPNFNQLIGGGKNVSGTGYYSASTLADHTDHVHIAIKDEVAQAFAQASGSQYGPGQMPSYPGTGGPAGTTDDPMNVQLPASQVQQMGPGQQLGQDILGGMAQVFGLDGSVFKDPTSFGLFKLFKGFMGLKPKDGGSSDGSISGSGGGGGLFSSLLQGIIPQPFGPLQSGSPKDAPGQFMPGMPGSQGGGAVNFPQIAQGAPGAPGPGNVDNSITVNTTGSTQQAFDSAHGANVPRMRQQLRPLP